MLQVKIQIPWLVVDDVYTTGTSFMEFCGEDDCLKWVVFALKVTENGVRAPAYYGPERRDI